MSEPEKSVFVSFVDTSEEDRQQKMGQFLSANFLEWAHQRATALGDWIIPKHVCVTLPGRIEAGQPTANHSTYFVEHRGLNPRTEEIFHVHHMMCDCVTRKDLNDQGSGVNLGACTYLEATAKLRALRFGAEIRGGTLATVIPEAAHEAAFANENVAMQGIETALVKDKFEPESWPGTVISGRLSVEQAVLITAQEPDVVVWSAELMQSQGKIVFDGQDMRLAA